MMSLRNKAATLAVVAIAVTIGLMATGGRTTRAQPVDCVNTEAGVLCISLEPQSTINAPGTDHTVTATVTENAVPVAAFSVTILVFDGPNAAVSSDAAVIARGETDQDGRLSLTYTGDGGQGTDDIIAIACAAEGTSCGLQVDLCLLFAEGCVANAENNCLQTLDCAVEVATKTWVEPTPTPTATPAGESVVWGDNNCSGSADPVDSLLTLRFDAGLSTNTGACPDLGQVVDVASSSPHTWGDVDCGGDVTPVDSLKLLRYDAGLSVAQAVGCPLLGSAVLVVATQPPPTQPPSLVLQVEVSDRWPVNCVTGPFGACDIASPGFRFLIIYLPYTDTVDGFGKIYEYCSDGSIFLIRGDSSQYSCAGATSGDDRWAPVFEVPSAANDFTLSIPGLPLIDVPPAP